MAVTSQQSIRLLVGDVLLQDWKGAGLLKPSIIKPVITTLDPALVAKTLGKLAATDHSALRHALSKILG
jgi:mRNA interferase MazF